ncbi:MAG: hypothetical protein AVDCRST_MAG95-3010 [uncultured Adhaeribacter sp.]|uniref:Uncharacterized protein n=1 Tax=uncultured Adhaeribacter sp. TaxID=448109 RepID=A0A6J4JEW8_9BACT|nr:MAG: hypothetical protein AVDCRST_MAG95-3010 [uncultured Adhaeribacter sp.]
MLANAQLIRWPYQQLTLDYIPLFFKLFLTRVCASASGPITFHLQLPNLSIKSIQVYLHLLFFPFCTRKYQLKILEKLLFLWGNLVCRKRQTEYNAHFIIYWHGDE